MPYPSPFRGLDIEYYKRGKTMEEHNNGIFGILIPHLEGEDPYDVDFWED